jgi:hypothetical protein
LFETGKGALRLFFFFLPPATPPTFSFSSETSQLRTVCKNPALDVLLVAFVADGEPVVDADETVENVSVDVVGCMTSTPLALTPPPFTGVLWPALSPDSTAGFSLPSLTGVRDSACSGERVSFFFCLSALLGVEGPGEPRSGPFLNREPITGLFALSPTPVLRSSLVGLPLSPALSLRKSLSLSLPAKTEVSRALKLLARVRISTGRCGLSAWALVVD